MKLVPEGELKHGRIKSEGKLLEIIPIIIDPVGMPMMLPPAVWHVDNWILGMDDWYTQNSPLTIWSNSRNQIPGTNSSQSVSITFLVRICEDGDAPAGVPVQHIDAAAVRDLIEAIKIAPSIYTRD